MGEKSCVRIVPVYVYLDRQITEIAIFTYAIIVDQSIKNHAKSFIFDSFGIKVFAIGIYHSVLFWKKCQSGENKAEIPRPNVDPSLNILLLIRCDRLKVHHIIKLNRELDVYACVLLNASH